MNIVVQFAQKIILNFQLTLKCSSVAYLSGLLRTRGKANCSNMGAENRVSHDFFSRSLAKIAMNIKEIDESLVSIASACSKNSGKTGYLVCDETLVSKCFSTYIEGTSFGYSSTAKKVIKGLNLVVLAWSNGRTTIPLGFKLWKSKAQMGPHYKTKLELAQELFLQFKNRVKYNYIFADGAYSSQNMMRFFQKNGFRYVVRIPCNRKVQNARATAQLRHHPSLKLRKGQSHRVIKATYKGMQCFFVACKREKRNGTHEVIFLVSNMHQKAHRYLLLYKRRWIIETLFRTLKQSLGMSDCQSTLLARQEAHIKICFLSYALLSIEKIRKRKKSAEATLSFLRAYDLNNCNPILSKKPLQSLSIAHAA